MSQNPGMVVSFAGVVVIGFALSGWYLGERILAAETRAATQPSSASVQLQTTPPVAATSPAPPTQPQAIKQDEPAEAPPDDGTDIYGLPPGTIP
ncbi:MAG TPA: hypothetical protein VKX49_12010 [Bryobacteraceae bacterium]|nr:hypothetical protein [Bryobacteraceae bacterium]